MPEHSKVDRAWVQARVNEAGTVDDARPDGITTKLWREVCKKLDVRPEKPKSELEIALLKLVDRA